MAFQLPRPTEGGAAVTLPFFFFFYLHSPDHLAILHETPTIPFPLPAKMLLLNQEFPLTFVYFDYLTGTDITSLIFYLFCTKHALASPPMLSNMINQTNRDH